LESTIVDIKFILADPQLRARVDDWVRESGCSERQLLEEAVATYLNWDAQKRARLDAARPNGSVGPAHSDFDRNAMEAVLLKLNDDF
jgi:hypothetical protein